MIKPGAIFEQNRVTPSKPLHVAVGYNYKFSKIKVHTTNVNTSIHFLVNKCAQRDMDVHKLRECVRYMRWKYIDGERERDVCAYAGRQREREAEASFNIRVALSMEREKGAYLCLLSTYGICDICICRLMRLRKFRSGNISESIGISLLQLLICG